MKKNKWIDMRMPFLSLIVVLVMLLTVFSFSGYLKANDETSGYQFHVNKNVDEVSVDIVDGACY